ncbi:MAG TPA: hypothetical protein VF980_18350 [Thermoanaerobaculia bacterium]
MHTGLFLERSGGGAAWPDPRGAAGQQHRLHAGWPDGTGASREGRNCPRGAGDGVTDRAHRLRREKKKLLSSWDRMVVPLPFTRAIFVYGEPFQIPRDGDVEEWRVRVEQSMNDLADRAERDFESLWREGER